MTLRPKEGRSGVSTAFPVRPPRQHPRRGRSSTQLATRVVRWPWPAFCRPARRPAGVRIVTCARTDRRLARGPRAAADGARMRRGHASRILSQRQRHLLRRRHAHRGCLHGRSDVRLQHRPGRVPLLASGVRRLRGRERPRCVRARCALRLGRERRPPRLPVIDGPSNPIPVRRRERRMPSPISWAGLKPSRRCKQLVETLLSAPPLRGAQTAWMLKLCAGQSCAVQ
jgi:hypothetical protein